MSIRNKKQATRKVLTNLVSSVLKKGTGIDYSEFRSVFPDFSNETYKEILTQVHNAFDKTIVRYNPSHHITPASISPYDLDYRLRGAEVIDARPTYIYSPSHVWVESKLKFDLNSPKPSIKGKLRFTYQIDYSVKMQSRNHLHNDYTKNYEGKFIFDKEMYLNLRNSEDLEAIYLKHLKGELKKTSAVRKASILRVSKAYVEITKKEGWGYEL